jgi:prophage maintenance system killer protein
MAFTGDDGTIYLDTDDILAAYAAVFRCTPQEAADQLRSRVALEGALARPLTHAHYGGADLALQAAVLGQGIAETQPFVEGNKRVGLSALRAFLHANGFTVTAPQEARARWMIELSRGLTAEALAAEIRGVMRRVPVPPQP